MASRRIDLVIAWHFVARNAVRLGPFGPAHPTFGTGPTGALRGL